MKFLCDEMLGTLAKWLRILGYDTEYVKDRDDEELLRIAREEGRIIITRDKLLAKKAGNALYLNEISLEKQIASVLEHFNLKIDEDKLLSRCTICNEIVIPIEKEKVKEKVPENAWKSHDKFWICPKCGKIYWIGSHWKNMKERIENIRRLP